jgi:hypothetical protein
MKKIIKKTTDSAVVGMVSAVLVIGLLVAVISIIQVVYVPIIMEQREAEHMDKVTEQFGSLTSVIDSQAASQTIGVPIPSFITLGNEELPFLVSSKAFGTLEILDNATTITITNDSGGASYTYSLGIITYSSDNAYYLDQSFTYEAGAMIVSQSEGSTMVCQPGFIIDLNRNTQVVNISFDVVNISSVGDKTTAGGFGTYPIQTEFKNISTTLMLADVRNVTLVTDYSNAWFVFFNHSLIRAGLDPGDPEDPYSPQFLLADTGNAIHLDFPNYTISTVNIVFKIIEISAQVGPGWAD